MRDNRNRVSVGVGAAPLDSSPTGSSRRRAVDGARRPSAGRSACNDLTTPTEAAGDPIRHDREPSQRMDRKADP